MKRIFISLLICTSVTSCCLSGCGNDVSQNAENSISTNSVSESNKIVDIKTVEPPENGWTIESILNATYICGKQLCYPLRLSDLGGDFHVDDSEKTEFSEKVNVELKHDEENICSVMYSQSAVVDGYQNAEICMLGFCELFTDEPNSISVNGITLGSSLSDVEEKIGSPDNNNKSYVYTYKSSESDKLLLSFSFDVNEQVNDIQLFIQNGVW